MASTSKPQPDSANPETRNWGDLPHELTSQILFKVGVIDILKNAQWVCSTWWNICKDPLMWRTVDTIDLRFANIVRHSDIICRLAIDNSRGLSVGISLGHHAHDYLLLYIANSGCHLRRLQLACCYAITERGFSDAIKRFPLLEELDISSCFLSNDALKVVGQSCPLLKSLKFNRLTFRDPFINPNNNLEAFAIAKTMPGLRHLELIGNQLSHDGLVAILDGCPHLESLGLWDCLNLSFEGSLQKRCSEQVKEFMVSM